VKTKNASPDLLLTLTYHILPVRKMVWYGLFMQFCDSNLEITRMQQEETQ